MRSAEVVYEIIHGVSCDASPTRDSKCAVRASSRALGFGTRHGRGGDVIVHTEIIPADSLACAQRFMVYTSSFGIPIVARKGLCIYTFTACRRRVSTRAYLAYRVYIPFYRRTRALRRRVPVKGIGMYTPYVYLSPGAPWGPKPYNLTHRTHVCASRRRHSFFCSETFVVSFAACFLSVSCLFTSKRFHRLIP